MTTLTTIDPAGRIVLPKSALESLNLAPGDSIELSASNGEITLRPVRTSSPLVQEMGVWVYRSGTTPSTDVVQIIDEVREERIRDLAQLICTPNDRSKYGGCPAYHSPQDRSGDSLNGI